MKQMIELTEEEYHKIVGVRKHQCTRTIEAVKPLLSDIDSLSGARGLKDERLRELATGYSKRGKYVPGSSEIPKDANAYILSRLK